MPAWAIYYTGVGALIIGYPSAWWLIGRLHSRRRPKQAKQARQGKHHRK